MRNSLLVVALLLALPVIASAQDEVPKVEIFGGYSYLRADNATGLSSQQTSAATGTSTTTASTITTAPLDRDLNGFEVSVTNNLNGLLGIEASFSGHFTNAQVNGSTLDRNIYFVTVGPRLTLRRFEKFTPFLHIMAGMARQDVSNQQNQTTAAALGLVNQSDTGLAFVAGGGVDFNLNERFALRLFQTDYILTRFSNRNGASSQLNQANFRASTGLVVRFGEQ
ncbi:MAG: outer membrane beta-barrel protein [Blastocatellia bacterium]|nr:outer membrane beta-barrel protein [Blastocatellia bacterium]